MNRLVLIGNGFDLAHGLKTRYENFFYWYWEQRVNNFVNERNKKVSEDVLCKLICLGYDTWLLALMYDIDLKYDEEEKLYNYIANSEKFKIEFSPFFERIAKSIKTKGWVDIENEYYDLLKEYVLRVNDISEVKKLNAQLRLIQDKLVEYLKSIEISDKMMRKDIRQKIYAPFNKNDISNGGMAALKQHIDFWLNQDKRSLEIKLSQFGSNCYMTGFVDDYRKKYGGQIMHEDEIPIELLLPNRIMLLNFNYTHTADLYLKDGSIFSMNQIHGNIDNPSSVIFGHGDEKDVDYEKIVDMDDNCCMANLKPIKYMEADNYSKLLSFIEEEPFQIVIMGHSCGKSDRTLMNYLFEHKNCISIKPYYRQMKDGSDSYLEMAQNITRNFTGANMGLMRDRLVKKPFCEPLTRALE